MNKQSINHTELNIKKLFEEAGLYVRDAQLTMIEAVKQLNQAQMKASICVGIHAVFADHAYQRLRDAGAGAVVTCNTIQHASNQIDLSSQLAEGIQEQLDE